MAPFGVISVRLRDYLKQMSQDQRDAFASLVASSTGHLKNVGYGYKPCSPALAAAIERHSGSKGQEVGSVSRRLARNLARTHRHQRRPEGQATEESGLTCAAPKDTSTLLSAPRRSQQNSAAISSRRTATARLIPNSTPVGSTAPHVSSIAVADGHPWPLGVGAFSSSAMASKRISALGQNLAGFATRIGSR